MQLLYVKSTKKIVKIIYNKYLVFFLRLPQSTLVLALLCQSSQN